MKNANQMEKKLSDKLDALNMTNGFSTSDESKWKAAKLNESGSSAEE